MYVGFNPTSIGTYDLKWGSLNAGDINVANQGKGYFNQSGGDVKAYGISVGGWDAYGEYNISHGSLLAPYGTISVGVSESGEGKFIQSGDSIVQTKDLSVGGTGKGSYYLKDNAQLDVFYGWVHGTGNFEQTGGILNSPFFYVGSTAGVTGGIPNVRGPANYLFENGVINTWQEQIGAFSDDGYFIQNGGQNNVKDFMILGGDPNDNNTGFGSYALNGGILNVEKGQPVSISIGYHGQSHFLMTGGTLNAGIIKNYSVFEVKNGGTVENPLMIDAEVFNNNEFLVSHAAVNFPQKFTNNGALRTEVAVSNFQDLQINDGGFISAKKDDIFNISGNFINLSKESSSWDTSEAKIVFTGGNFHDVIFNSQDKGAVEDVYNRNFSWGSVNFSKNPMNLQQDSLDYYWAVYTKKVAGLDLSNDVAMNLSGDNNIYYLATLNGDLGGKTYSFFNGSGKVIPVGVTPEPLSTVLFFVGGIPIAAGIYRKRRRT